MISILFTLLYCILLVVVTLPFASYHSNSWSPALLSLPNSPAAGFKHHPDQQKLCSSYRSWSLC